jgi:uncharacterized protein (TIGR02996 family)
MNHETGLLRNILDVPDDDAPRLVYADWLEEHGNSERAEFIRLQIELARNRQDCPRRREMAFRARQLLDQHESAWVGDLAKFTYEWHFARGFVDAAGMDLVRLRRFGKQLFSAAPIRRLTLTGLGGKAEELRHLPVRHHLTSLNVCASELTNEALAGLARSSCVKDIRELGLLFNAIDDGAVPVLCDTDFFRDLACLRLGANPFTEEGRQRLQTHLGDGVSFLCERDENHLYQFQDDRGFHPGFASGFTQVLPQGSAIAMRLAVFDHEGTLLGIESRPVEIVWPDWKRHYRNLDAVLEHWRQELDFLPATIRVKRFGFSDKEGINDFNWWQETFGRPGDPQRADLQGAVENWYAEGQFEWDYGDDNCWLDRSGEVTDT